MSKYYFKYNLSGGGRSSCDVNLSQRKSYKKLVEIEHNFYIAMYSGCQDAGDHCRSVCSIVVTAEVRAFLFIRFYSVFFFSIRNPKTPTVEVVVGLQYYRRLVRGHHVRGSLVSDVL